MYYRPVLINKDTKERRAVYSTFTSKKKAIQFAEDWKKAMPNADVEIYKDDMKTRIY